MAMDVVSHRLKGVTFRAAQSAGSKLKTPVAVCLHDTAGSLKKYSSVTWFESPLCETSAHIVVERDGTVTQMVAFDTIAFHAGRSSWKGRQGCNAFTIGIEIVSPGVMVERNGEGLLIYKSTNAQGKVVERIVERFPVSECERFNTKAHGRGVGIPYTPQQVKAVEEICQALVRAYPSIEDITTHWAISPGRKVDTTPLYPLEELRHAVFGPAQAATLVEVNPEPVTVETVKPPGVVKATYESKSVWALLMGIGSWIAAQFEKAVNEFLDWIMWGLGILPNVVSEVKTTLTNGELMAGWLKVSWPKIAFYVTIGCVAIAVVRHVQDKRKLEAANQQIKT